MTPPSRPPPPRKPAAAPASEQAGDPAPNRFRAARSATLVAVAILVSKLVGLVRQRVTAHFFGTGLFADVIAAAFRVGNVAQNLLGEGTLSATFIPIYARLREEGKDDEATAFARSALGLLGVAVALFTAVGIALAPQLTLVVAAGFDPDKLAVTVRLVRWLFPMTGLLVLCAWALGVLNAHRRFFVPYVAPVIWSTAQICALVVGGGWLAYADEPLALLLAGGALGGAALELGFLMWRARRHVGTVRAQFDYRSEPIRKALRRLPHVLLGRGVIQISGLVDTLLVSFLATGANAVFGYAQTLYLLPMSLLGTGEAAVSLTEMSRDTAQQNDEETLHRRLRARLTMVFTRVGTLAVPAMVVLIGFGSELITVLLRTGRFDTTSTLRVASAVRIYGFALLANAGVRQLATTFFALGETRLPARLAVVRMVMSALLAVSLMGRMGVDGVVLGAVIAGWLEVVLLGRALHRRLGGLGLGAVPWFRLMALAAATAGVPSAAAWALPAAWRAQGAGSLAVLVAVGLVFALTAPTLGLIELRRRRP
ncbi:MAG: murein biosynthesis integral membrane protein MurJ [Myxococcota bacterium]